MPSFFCFENTPYCWKRKVAHDRNHWRKKIKIVDMKMLHIPDRLTQIQTIVMMCPTVFSAVKKKKKNTTFSNSPLRHSGFLRLENSCSGSGCCILGASTAHSQGGEPGLWPFSRQSPSQQRYPWHRPGLAFLAHITVLSGISQGHPVLDANVLHPHFARYFKAAIFS